MALYRMLVLTGLLAACGSAYAQKPIRPTPPLTAPTSRPAAGAKLLTPVRVTAITQRGYLAASAQMDTFGSFGNAPLHDTPAAITVITRDQIDDRQPRTLSELVRGDSAVGDSYAPIGYYQDVAIRGFALDLATGYRLNEMSMTGEQALALEDKQRVEVLKGLAGLEAGIVAPGGLINYVSKRPADVHSATLGTDSHGSRYLAADLGGWLTPTFGLRMNIAHEGIRSWVEHADGHRNFISLAADWKLSADATLRLDGNYQSSAQRSVSGYQLLGGTVLPAHPSRSRMLGFEPWQQPVGIDSSNVSARYDQRLGDQWQWQVAASSSRSVIDDNVAFAYGCFQASACADGSSPGWYFAPNGDYDIYDYRSPGYATRNDEVRTVFKGGLDTGGVSHEVNIGASAFHRTLNRGSSVFDYVGTANIDQPEPPYFAPSPNLPGPRVTRLDSWQRSAFALDRLHLGEHWQLLLGGRFVRLHEREYDADGALERDTRLSQALPQAALMWQPDARLSTYVSYSESLALGQTAPAWTSNDGTVLAPIRARQVETGVKYAWSNTLNLQAALYRLRQPWQFADPDNSAAGFTFLQRGQQVHTGLELNAAGQLGDRLRLTASANFIQARGRDSGAPDYAGHQVVNVPRVRTALYFDYQLASAPGLALLAGWRYSASNVATPTGLTQVPAYHLFDAGLRYAMPWRAHTLTWRLNVDNVFNHFYWRDTGSSGGDSYLFPGAPRLARLSLRLDL